MRTTRHSAACEWLREQTERQRKGLCVFCGLSLRECWCGEDEPVEYRPLAADDADGAPA